jgi:hypothetical protein
MSGRGWHGQGQKGFCRKPYVHWQGFAGESANKCNTDNIFLAFQGQFKSIPICCHITQGQLLVFFPVSLPM